MHDRSWFAIVGHWLFGLSVLVLLISPAQAGIEDRNWTLYRTPYADVITSADAERVSTLIRDIAIFRKVVSWLADGKQASVGHRRVTFLVLDGPQDLDRLFKTPQGVNGFTRPSLAGDLMVVVRPERASMFNTGNQVVFHEYVHQLLQMRSGSRQPTWYAEGIADFLSTLSIHEDRVRLGAAPRARIWSLQNDEPMVLEEVLQVGSALALSSEDRNRFYARSWLLVHHLLLADDRVDSRFAPRLASYLQKFDGGEASVDAFASTFGELYLQMSQRLDVYPVEERMVEYPLSLFSSDNTFSDNTFSDNTFSDNTFETKPLTFIERTLKLAEYSREFHPEEALRMYMKALRRSKDHPELLAGMAVAHGELGNFDAAFASLQAARAVAADDFTVRIEAGRLQLMQCREQPQICRGEAGRKAIADDFTAAWKLRPDDVEAKTRHAQDLLLTAERGNALPLLLEAYSAAPWSFDVVQSIGLAYLARGDLARARVHLGKALGWAVDYPELQTELAALLSGIEALEERLRREESISGAKKKPWLE